MLLPNAFDYHYFDDPDACGYRGYARRPYGEGVLEPWEVAARVCRDRAVRTALDLGCAKGYLVEALLASHIDAVGYDISDYALSYAAGLPCHKHDIRRGIPGRADAVIALGVLMYVSEAELPTVLRGISQASGRLFLFSSYFQGDRQVVPDPLRVITRSREWWRTAIESGGFAFGGREAYFDVYVKEG